MKTGPARQVFQSFFGLERRETITRFLYAIIISAIGLDMIMIVIRRWDTTAATATTPALLVLLLLQFLLELSRVGRHLNEPREINFHDLVKETLELLHGRISQAKATIHIGDHLPTVRGDFDRLLEVLQNLIDNACKFMGDQDHPMIEIGHDGFDGGIPVFYVRDNGIGIQPQIHDKIFGLFNKLDVHSEGTGVGLTLVKRIIGFHGSRIWVESKPDGGTAFFFTLPTPSGR